MKIKIIAYHCIESRFSTYRKEEKNTLNEIKQRRSFLVINYWVGASFIASIVMISIVLPHIRVVITLAGQ